MLLGNLLFIYVLHISMLLCRELSSLFSFFFFSKSSIMFQRTDTAYHLTNPLLMDIWSVSIFKNIFKQDILLLMSWHPVWVLLWATFRRSQKTGCNLIEGNKLLSKRLSPFTLHPPTRPLAACYSAPTTLPTLGRYWSFLSLLIWFVKNEVFFICIFDVLVSICS